MIGLASVAWPVAMPVLVGRYFTELTIRRLPDVQEMERQSEDKRRKKRIERLESENRQLEKRLERLLKTDGV